MRLLTRALSRAVRPPTRWAVLYLGAIPLFALAFTALPGRSLHDANALYEPATGNDAVTVIDAMTPEIRRRVRQTSWQRGVEHFSLDRKSLEVVFLKHPEEGHLFIALAGDAVLVASDRNGVVSIVTTTGKVVQVPTAHASGSAWGAYVIAVPILCFSLLQTLCVNLRDRLAEAAGLFAGGLAVGAVSAPIRPSWLAGVFVGLAIGAASIMLREFGRQSGSQCLGPPDPSVGPPSSQRTEDQDTAAVPGQAQALAFRTPSEP